MSGLDILKFNVGVSASDGYLSGPDLEFTAELVAVTDVETGEQL